MGQGLGQPNGNTVKVYTGGGAATAVSFPAYGAGQWGVNVASGDIDGGASAEILTGPGPGDVYGPQVKAFDRAGAFIAKVNFFAYGTLRYGVNPAAIAVDGDAFAEILTGAGPGAVFGPHVRAFNYDGVTVTPINRISFFAYTTLKYGVNVEGGALDADAAEEILTGPGPGVAFPPQVRGFDDSGTTVNAMGKVNFYAFTVLQFGVNVAGASVDGDAFDEIACAPGPGPTIAHPSRFLGYGYDSTTVTPLTGFDRTPYTTFYGGRVGLGDVDGAGAGDLLAGAGRDPSADSTVSAFSYDGSALSALAGSFVPFGTSSYGVNLAGGVLGY